MNSGLQVYNEQAKLAQWAQVVAQCRDSGLSVRQWCQGSMASMYRPTTSGTVEVSQHVFKNRSTFSMVAASAPE